MARASSTWHPRLGPLVDGSEQMLSQVRKRLAGRLVWVSFISADLRDRLPSVGGCSRSMWQQGAEAGARSAAARRIETLQSLVANAASGTSRRDPATAGTTNR